MHPFLLDGGGAGLLYVGVLLLIVFMVLAVLLEAGIMAAFKYNLFRKALLHSFIVNLASLAVGLIVITGNSSIFHLDDFGGYAAFLALTVVIELSLLYVLNQQKPFSRTLLVCLVMNVLTYLLLFLFAGRGSSE